MVGPIGYIGPVYGLNFYYSEIWSTTNIGTVLLSLLDLKGGFIDGFIGLA